MLARPTLAATVPFLHLWEFPIAVVVVGLTLLFVVRRPRGATPAAAPAWRRHEQKVRPLADPETERLAAPLEAWVRDGSRRDEAADVLARAATGDEAQRARLRETHAEEMARAGSPRKRARYLETHADQIPLTPAPDRKTPDRTPGA